jgi:hypothetical protein
MSKKKPKPPPPERYEVRCIVQLVDVAEGRVIQTAEETIEDLVACEKRQAQAVHAFYSEFALQYMAGFLRPLRHYVGGDAPHSVEVAT